MEIDLDSLGIIGKSIKEFNYETFYEQQVNQLNQDIHDGKEYVKQIEEKIKNGEATVQEQQILKNYKYAIEAQEAVLNNKDYLDKYIYSKLKHAVYSFLDKFKSNFKDVEVNPSSLEGLSINFVNGPVAKDLLKTTPDSVVPIYEKLASTSISYETMREIVCKKTGLPYTPLEEIEMIGDQQLYYENGYFGDKEHTYVPKPIRLEYLPDVEEIMAKYQGPTHGSRGSR